MVLVFKKNTYSHLDMILYQAAPSELRSYIRTKKIGALIWHPLVAFFYPIVFWLASCLKWKLVHPLAQEPLGTHGHMKCIFDGHVSQQDAVCLNLYKRMFPKWNYDPYVDIPLSKKKDVAMDEMA